MSSSDNPLAIKNLLSGIIVTVVGGVILAFIIRDAIFSSQPGTTPTPGSTSTMTENPPTETAQAPNPTVAAQFNDFIVCPQPCKGNEDVRTFPEGTKKLYAQWRFENVPVGAHYVRSWSLDGMGAWVKYDCIWSGPTVGVDEVVISEPRGFHSGTWEVTISVEDAVVLQETFVVEGNNQYWDPAGTIASCYDR